jgi:hypothetical protein
MKRTQTSERLQLPVDAHSSIELVSAIKSVLATTNSDFDIMSNDIAKKMMFSNKQWCLTKTGYNILSTVYQTYTSKNPATKVLTGKILLGMDQCCASPWFIQGETVTVFDGVLHFELEMVNGNLNDFIDFKKPQKN